MKHPERLPGQERREMLLDAAMPLAEIHTYTGVSRDMVAEAAGVSPALLSRYWTSRQFQAALMERAVATRNLRVLAQGMVRLHPVAIAAPYDLRRDAAAAIVGAATVTLSSRCKLPRS